MGIPVKLQVFEGPLDLLTPFCRCAAARKRA